ncbi:voltage-gated potassium channel [Backusella circina FSU 941]|nr:voltage-gated potassium channel [Backusella circina FSU 941]
MHLYIYIGFLISQHPVSILFSFRLLIEVVTTLPFLISIHIPNGRYLYVPYFLRSWILLLRLRSSMKIKINLQITDKTVDPLNTKLIHLVSTMVVLIYNGACAFQYIEVTFGTHNYTIIESIYVVMVTLSTVGYGDITPDTQGSRIVMMLLIVIALAVLPTLIGDVSDTIQRRRDGFGHVSKGSTPFILIVGSFTPEQAMEILNGFLNTENTQFHLSVVFLDINKPTEQLKLMERNSIWGHRVHFLHGSVLDEKTLLRVKARYAEAIFTLSNQNASDPSKEDERNTVRLWSLHCHTVSNDVPIYSCNLSPSTAIYQKVAKEIICVREFKQYLLAMNCRCRGASTLLTNLLHQRQPINRYDESWQAQFDDGSCNEIYTAKAASCITHLSFGQATLYLYQETQVILFAIKTFNHSKQDYEILLNPSNLYVIKISDICVYIAEGPSEIQDIDSLGRPYPGYFNDTSISPHSPDIPPPLMDDASFPKPSLSANTTISHTSSYGQRSIDQTFSIDKLPPQRHALLTGSRALIKRLGKKDPVEDDTNGSPLCYLLNSPVSLEDVSIEETEHLSGHIVVCLHREVINVFKFIYNLRSPHIRPEELQDIVLLCAKKPSDRIFNLISHFPKVYFMEGNCRHPEDLLRAGVKRAKQVVVLSEKECLDQYERNSDSPAIMTSHILDLLLQERPKDAYTIVNLVETSNIKFMHLLQEKDIAEEIDVFYTPAYAAGDVVADSLISNVLLNQTYYKPDIVSIIKTLCGMHGGRCLTIIPLPTQFIGKNYAALFKCFLIHHEVLAIGLLRAPDNGLGNELPFVYANPVPSLMLKSTDQVYVFSPSDWIL